MQKKKHLSITKKVIAVKMNVLFFIIIVLFLVQVVSADTSTCGVTYDTLNGNVAVRNNIQAVTVNDTLNTTWTSVENLTSATVPTNTSFSDPSCIATNPFIRTSPDLSVTLEFFQNTYEPQYSNQIVVTNNHVVHLNRNPGLTELYLYSYDITTGTYECGVNFSYGTTSIYDYIHKGDGNLVFFATTDIVGTVTVGRVDLANNCNVDWLVAYNTTTFKPTEAGDIAVDSSRVEVWFGMGQSLNYRFLDTQFNKNTGALNRGILLRPNLSPLTEPGGIVIDSATGNAYASGRHNAYAWIIQINGTTPGATFAARQLARQDQTAGYNSDDPIFFCNGGASVCSYWYYDGGYSRVFITNMTPFNQTREYLSSSNVELYGIRIDPAYDNYLYTYGADYNNNEGAVMVINANTGAISFDRTFSNMSSIDGLASSGDFGLGNSILTVSGGDLNGIAAVQIYDIGLGTVNGFNVTYVGSDWGLDVQPTSSPTQFVGYVTDLSGPSTIAFLFGPYSGPGPSGPVPEFSLTTLLLATLLAGGLVLFVVRKRR